MSSFIRSRLALLAATLFIVLQSLACRSENTTTNPAPVASPASDRIVVMISIDGLAGFYLDDPKAPMPTPRALAADGASAMMTASNPTVTWPNHTTLVTGVTPARHGVIGNNYLDRATGKPITLIADPVFDKDQIVKTKTIYDIAHATGLKTAAINWPASRNAKSLDWTTPDVHEPALYEKYSTPSLLAECAAAGIASPLKELPGIDLQISKDDTDTRIFNLILHNHRPQLALLHLVNVDHTQHLKGPRTPEAYAAIAKADEQVRAVWDELKRDFPGKATLIVVSDHGFSSIDHAIFPNVILRKAGLIDVKGTRITGGSVQVLPQGGCAMLYLNDKSGSSVWPDRDALVAQIQKVFDGVKGIRKVVTPSMLKDYGFPDPRLDPHGPDMLLLADEGWVFGDTAAGELPFNQKPERSGSHGHDASLPNLRATFIAAGPSIRPTPRLPHDLPNLDVAPTLANLLHLTMPDVDGKPASAILRD
jgi:predicted AlkP superfamily pyrophosphatase or phosphodiesterase